MPLTPTIPGPQSGVDQVDPLASLCFRKGSYVSSNAWPTANETRFALIVEDAFGSRLASSRVAANRKVVLSLFAELVFGGNLIAVHSHMFVAINVPQSVVDHRINKHAIAHSIALPRLRQQIGREAHVLHSAGDHDV